MRVTLGKTKDGGEAAEVEHRIGDVFNDVLHDGRGQFHLPAPVAVFDVIIVMPLSKAIIAVLVLYYAVGHWNSYFNAFIYISKRELYPLQVFLREILIMNSIDQNAMVDDLLMATRQGMYDLLKYALIVVASAPIICVYPFIQKYFVKGVMIGSVKG